METLVQTNLRLRKRLIKLADMLRVARYSADHDVLTGLANRRLLYDRLQQAMALADRQHRQLAVLMMDLDGFKAINDRLGHKAGDVLLQQVAGRLSSCLRMTDTASRLGGDEFVVMLPQISGPESVSTVIGKLRRCLAAPYLLARETVLVGTSIGVTLYKGQKQRPAQLLQQADRNMYRVKVRRHDRADALHATRSRLARERKLAKA